MARKNNRQMQNSQSDSQPRQRKPFNTSKQKDAHQSAIKESGVADRTSVSHAEALLSIPSRSKFPDSDGASISYLGGIRMALSSTVPTTTSPVHNQPKQAASSTDLITTNSSRGDSLVAIASAPSRSEDIKSYNFVPPLSSYTAPAKFKRETTDLRHSTQDALSIYPVFNPQTNSEIYRINLDSMSNVVGLSSTPTTLRSSGGEPIQYSSEYMLHLRRLLSPLPALRENGYVLQNLTEEELECKKKCRNCGKAFIKRWQESKKKAAVREEKKAAAKAIAGVDEKDDKEVQITVKDMHLPSVPSRSNQEIPCTSTKPIKTSAENVPLSISKPPTSEPIMRCISHHGLYRHRQWSCCRQQFGAEGCRKYENHIAIIYPDKELEHRWKYHPTPKMTVGSDHRPAVAIDCEMGVSKPGDSELIRITMIDYFSGAILVDSLVYPKEEMEHYNTRFSGVTRQDMASAYRNGTCFIGRDAARMAVCHFVGPDTIVVGHSAQNDLTALRWIHPIVLDTQLTESIRLKLERAAAESEARARAENEAREKEKLEKENLSFEPEEGVSVVSTPWPVMQAEKPKEESQGPRARKVKGSGALSLKTLAMKRMGRAIQMGGKAGHDSLEDALATRDIAHWNVVDSMMSRDPYNSSAFGEVGVFGGFGVYGQPSRDVGFDSGGGLGAGGGFGGGGDGFGV